MLYLLQLSEMFVSVAVQLIHFVCRMINLISSFGVFIQYIYFVCVF